MFTALAIATISIALLFLIVDLITTFIISGYVWFILYISILIGFVLLFVAFQFAINTLPNMREIVNHYILGGEKQMFNVAIMMIVMGIGLLIICEHDKK